MKTDDSFRYDIRVVAAIRAVVKDVLAETALIGLPANHNLKLRFATESKRSIVPRHIIKKFPSEMTISILKNNYENLQVEDQSFTIYLWFAGKLERLKIAFDDLIEFQDERAGFSVCFDSSPYNACDSSDLKIYDPTQTDEPTTADVIFFDRAKKKRAWSKHLSDH
ncbi:hypothetical protein G6K88_34750 [Agrobacterium rhizogenes]|uniref:ClpXP protease specificity-enhancing factor SspB n=1 Tax=Rhizobium rhizogenes TaxID=359 RepID=UPI001375BB6E|nr:ClpXP protease specificity-enhancing factor SspB [Rhizobium rhizogenes]NTG39381.1 hypothetical protein [Rhizobium rhizogenes]NTG58632.1 hypothetical protein [Rhizobium rhizogenes]NTI07169.1 hypothetical protein [Rhizobium rhizogenes]NTI13988.1 hypothetical protein [Rhizobium rhizogenes]